VSHTIITNLVLGTVLNLCWLRHLEHVDAKQFQTSRDLAFLEKFMPWKMSYLYSQSQRDETSFKLLQEMAESKILSVHVQSQTAQNVLREDTFVFEGICICFFYIFPISLFFAYSYWPVPVLAFALTQILNCVMGFYARMMIERRILKIRSLFDRCYFQGGVYIKHRRGHVITLPTEWPRIIKIWKDWQDEIEKSLPAFTQVPRESMVAPYFGGFLLSIGIAIFGLLCLGAIVAVIGICVYLLFCGIKVIGLLLL
jgi:hypothetical protein